MSRKEKQFQRLEQLEMTWQKMVVSELSKVANNIDSKYITRHMGHYTSDKYANNETRLIEKIENEVLKLRSTLALPENEGAKQILEEFVNRYRNGEGTASGVARKILKEKNSPVGLK